MRPTAYILCAALLLAPAGCDKSDGTTAKGGPAPSESAAGQATSSEPTAKAGTWTVGTVDVRAGQSSDGLVLPPSEAVATWLSDAIAAVESLEKTEEDSRAFLMYQAAVVDGVSGVPADEQPFLRVRVQARLEDPTRPESINKLMALGIVRDFQFSAEDGTPEGDTVNSYVREVVEEYVGIVARRFEALSATEEELVALLKSDDLAPEAALTSIHEARDRQVDAAVPVLVGLLGHESPSVVVAVAGALAELAPEKTAGDIVDAAGRLGREREYASLHRLIFIVGDLDQPVAREYLEGLTGHQIPDIRRAAEQALESEAPTERGQR